MSSTEEVLAQIGDALDDWEVGPDAMRCNASEGAQPPPPMFDAAAFADISRRVSVTVRVFAEGMKRALTDMAPRLHQLTIAYQATGHNRARCAFCSPMANPRPLCIDGHAYRRRTRRRKRP